MTKPIISWGALCVRRRDWPTACLDLFFAKRVPLSGDRLSNARLWAQATASELRSRRIRDKATGAPLLCGGLMTLRTWL
jgi:hypothetical protein